jgi:acyl carrier protein
MELLEQLNRILTRHFDIAETQLHPDIDIYEELGFYSIDAVDLIVELKQLTGLRIQPQDFKNIRTLNDLNTALIAMQTES